MDGEAEADELAGIAGSPEVRKVLERASACGLDVQPETLFGACWALNPLRAAAMLPACNLAMPLGNSSSCHPPPVHWHASALLTAIKGRVMVRDAFCGNAKVLVLGRQLQC